MLAFQNLTKTFRQGAVRAVDDLTLTVPTGEIFGFLGPNGAGKTTTIKMAAGLLRPDSGTVTVAGTDVWQAPLAAKRRIGYVPDTPDLYQHLTGLEYLHFMGDVYSVPVRQREEQTRRLGEMFALHDALGDRIGGYSHGMQQKLALMGALLHRPPVWILDEPMVGLDPRSAHLLKELMAEHCAAGNVVFFSTHVLEVAERLCHRIGIIRRGRLIACGTMAELRARSRAEGGSLEQIFLELTDQ